METLLTARARRWQELFTAALSGTAALAGVNRASDLLVANAAEIATCALAAEMAREGPHGGGLGAADSARIEMAKRSLRQWAATEAETLKGVAIGARPAHLAWQHALWLLDYIADLERALGGIRGPA